MSFVLKTQNKPLHFSGSTKAIQYSEYANIVHINTRQIPKSSYKYFIEHERDLITLSLQQEKKQKVEI